MKTYDDWKSTEPDNPDADEREADRREEEDERARYPERFIESDGD